MSHDDLSCPFCKAIVQSENLGQHCALIQYPYNETRLEALQALLQDPSVTCPTVIARDHVSHPSPEVYQEAMEIVRKYSGITKETTIPGHWGLQVMPGTWSNTGKGRMYANKGK